MEIKGLWLEDESSARNGAFVDALAAGIARPARDIGATHVEVSAVVPAQVRSRL